MLKKFEFVNGAPCLIFAAPTVFTLLGTPKQFPGSPSFAPPVPLPRSLFV